MRPLLLIAAVFSCTNKMYPVGVRAKMLCCKACIGTAILLNDDGSQHTVKTCKAANCKKNASTTGLCESCYKARLDGSKVGFVLVESVLVLVEPQD